MLHASTFCRLSLVLAASLLIGGCGEGNEGEEAPSGATCPENSTLTWDNFGKSFMETYCVRCHSETLSGAERQGAPSDHNFNSHELIMSQIDHIDEQAAAGSESTNTLMPIGSPAPAEEERRKLGEWLACGVP
ncbi:MAG: hypothetical protein JNL82_41765 [Myxococcales bacterium]|nr:hypothetical protein [Myxococcales bacterium]